MRLGNETFSFRYAGQPRLCHRCGREGHLVADCDEDKCSKCMGLDHLAQDCTSSIKCNVCGEEGHAGRSCQLNLPYRCALTSTWSKKTKSSKGAVPTGAQAGGRVLEHRLVGRVLVVRNLTLGLMNNNQLGRVLMLTKWHPVGQILVRNRLGQECRVRALRKSPRPQTLVRNRLCQESRVRALRKSPRPQKLVRNRLCQESRVRALRKSPRPQTLVRNRLGQECRVRALRKSPRSETGWEDGDEEVKFSNHR
ncbi:ZCCHC3 [Branchiostoma lanceolatum]|uniref:ZCCHC3 protein n=1 Tax=Branchiostoma lanceolatum TaxID=7740 RepID=A0A8J9VWA4_BRALA|nr:ZCCHC3 [Branchiostoma lanceolatum]